MLTRWSDNTFLSDYSDHWDEELLAAEILAGLNSDSEIINIGASREMGTRASITSQRCYLRMGNSDRTDTQLFHAGGPSLLHLR